MIDRGALVWGGKKTIYDDCIGVCVCEGAHIVLYFARLGHSNEYSIIILNFKVVRTTAKHVSIFVLGITLLYEFKEFVKN